MSDNYTPILSSQKHEKASELLEMAELVRKCCDYFGNLYCEIYNKKLLN